MREVFTDPVVRCVDCQRLVTREEIKEFGMCLGCGTKRVKNVSVLSADEVSMLIEKGFQEFVDTFDEVAHE